MDLPEHQLLHIPRGVPLRVAALAEPLGVALRVLRRLDPPRAAPILIAGAGPVGGLAALLLRHLGFGPLAILERNAGRAGLIAKLSGARILASDASEISGFTAGEGLRFAIEATGSQITLRFLLSALAGGGRLAMVGIFTGDQTVSANIIVERELELRGCSVFCEEQREALELLPDLAASIEQVIAPSETLYDRLIAGQSPYLKAIVEP